MAYKIYTSTYPNGVTMKTPNKFVVKAQDMVKESKTATGLTVIDRVRSRVRTIDISWDAMSRSDMATLINHFNADTGFTSAGTSVPKNFIMLEYPDPYDSNDIKKIFRVKDRSTPIFNSLTGYWDGLSLQLEER